MSIWDEKPRLWPAGMGGYGPPNNYYDAHAMNDWLEKLKAQWDVLDEHSGRWLHFVAVDFPSIRESLTPEKLMELREKADKWNYACRIIFQHRSRRTGYGTATADELIEDAWHIARDDFIAQSKLEAIRKLVEEELPQIGPVIGFRRRFYEVTGFDFPDWFKTEMEAET